MDFFGVFIVIFFVLSTSALLYRKRSERLWLVVSNKLEPCEYPIMECEKIRNRFSLPKLLEFSSEDVYLYRGIIIFRIGIHNPRRIDPGFIILVNKERESCEKIDEAINNYGDAKINLLFDAIKVDKYSDNDYLLWLVVGILPTEKELFDILI